MDCRDLNEELIAEHFQMNDLKVVMEILEKDDWSCSIDIKAAFNHIAVT
jgi:hypothetical protein